MKVRVYACILLLASTTIAFSSLSQTRPTTLYVNAGYTGSTEDGTAAHPFKTIRKALDKRASLGLSGMTTDEIIVVKPGDYYPNGNDMLIVNRTNGGYNGKWLTIVSETPFAATIHGDSLYNTMFAAMLSITDSAQYVKVKNFTFEHLRCNPSLTRWKASNGTYTATSPTVLATYNGTPLTTLYGDTIYEAQKDVKFGIQIVSDSRHIIIFDNDISDISWTDSVNPYKADSALTEAEKKILRNAWPSDNCGPLSVLGSDKDAMRDITIDGNEVHHNNPGWSESVTVNGYVDSFKVVNNLVHDNKNIGIVAAGNYPWVIDPFNGFTTPPAQNYARNGNISGNIVYNCLSPYAASAGIYLDGARSVLIERNQVYQNHVGISVGNETPNSHSGGHIIRNNILYDNVWTGMVLGSNGYNAWVENVKVLNNTFHRNNTRAATLLVKRDGNGHVQLVNGVAVSETFSDGGEIVTQRLSNSADLPGAKIVVQNNIIRSRKGVTLTALTPFETDSYTSTPLTKANLKQLLDWDYNLYYTEPGENINYDFAAAGFTGNTYNFANYKSQTGLDSNSKAVELSTVPSPDPVFVGGTVFPGRFGLVSGSAAYNTGNPSSAFSGTDDFIWNDRIMGGRIDGGALEFVVSGGPVTSLAPVKEGTSLTNNYSTYPNPVINKLTLRSIQQKTVPATVQFFDLAGRLVMQKKIVLNGGVNTVEISTFRQAGFVSGIYMVTVVTPLERKSFQIAVQ